MADAEGIAAAIERLEQALASRPGFGTTTCRAVTTLGADLRCTTEEGPWRIEADLARGLGGGAAAPNPSALLRAALGSCVAMGYRLRAARHRVPVTAVRVTVETESALAGMLGTDAAEVPGFRDVRYHVEIESPAPVDDVLRIVDEADALSPVLDALARTTALSRTVDVTGAA